MSAEDLLDVTALVVATGIPLGTWACWRARGEGPAYLKLGRLIRYRRRDVEMWLERHRVEPQPADDLAAARAELRERGAARKAAPR